MGEQIGQIQVSGKFGSLVGSKGRNGKVFLRAKAAKKDRVPTERQAIVQSRFKAAGSFANAAKTALRVGLKKKAKQLKCSIYNAFVKLNWDNFRSNNPDSVTINYPELIISMGDVPPVTFGSPDTSEPLTVQLTFQGAADQIGADATDQVYVYVHCPDAKEGILSDPVSRSAASVTVPVPSTWNGMGVRVFGFVVGGENNTYYGVGTPSNTIWIGNATIE